ncbi:MAG: MlaD family protein [Planctomycetota bacterium]
MNQANEWKLGLFVVLVLAAGGLALAVLGANKLDREVETFVTYFDESVQGLEVGSPVKFRGVRIGDVAEITVAPDRRRVQVVCAVDVKTLQRLGLHGKNGQHPNAAAGRFVPEDLRVQLVPQGITGVRFLGVDFFDPKEHPEPALGFPTPPNYIPATQSTLAGVEQALVDVANQIPALSRQVSSLLRKIEQTMDEIQWKDLSGKVISGIDRAERLMKQLDQKLQPLDVQKLQAEAEGLIKDVRERMELVERLGKRLEKEGGLLETGEKLVGTLERQAAAIPVERLDATLRQVDGAVAEVRSASLAFGELAREARDTPERLEATLRGLERAASSVRELADLLQRDSDMLLKGRARRD